MERGFDALDRAVVFAEDLTTSSFIAKNEYVGPNRLLKREYGNAAVLDKRNDSWSQSYSGQNAGYDANGLTIRHEWKNGASQLAALVSEWNGPGGVGTSRRVSELREHMFGHKDIYSFDSAYRMLSFDRNESLLSTRTLEGADKMTSFVDEGIDRMPQVDVVPAEAGLNQYSAFDAMPQLYNENGSLTSSESGTDYVYDSTNRLIEIRKNGALISQYAYDASNRRVRVHAVLLRWVEGA